VDRIALFSESACVIRAHDRCAGENEENLPMSRSLRIVAACAVLAGLGACAAPPPPAPVITAPPPKPLDAKTQLENHS
jgi:hypothetical protein